MTLRDWLEPSAFSLADGTTLTISNLLATDSTAANAVTPGTGGTIKASTLNSWSSSLAIMRGICGTTAQQTRLPFTANVRGAVSVYRYMSALSGSNLIPVGIRDASGNLLIRLLINTTGKLVIQNAGGTNLATSTASLTEGRWNRWEIVFNIGTSTTTGTCTVNIYQGNNTGTPDVTVTAPAANLGGTGSNTAALLDIGLLTAVSGTQQDWAFVRTNDGATTEIGPFLNAYNLGISDSAGGSDSLSRLLVAARSFADTAAGTDALTRAAAHPRSLADTAAGTDAVARSGLMLARSLADTAAATDAVARSTACARVLTDTAAGTDAVTRTTSRSRGLSDAAAGTDALSRLLALPRALSDAAAGTDAVVGTTPGGGNRPISDTAGGTDAVARGVAESRGLSDAAAATDSTARSTSRSRGISDGAPAVDALTRAKAGSRALSDTVTGTDTVTRAVATARPVSDATTLADLAARSLAFARSALDQALATDSVTGTARVIVPTAAERIFAVPRESRVLAVELELRTYGVRRESRALQVEAEDRVLRVRKEPADV